MIIIKLLKYLTIIFSFLSVFLLVAFIISPDVNYDSNESSDNMEDIKEQTIIDKYNLVCTKIKPYVVNAKVSIDNKEYIGEVLEDKGNGQTYHIKVDNESLWYKSYYVTILDIEEQVVDGLTDEEIEIFVNFSSFNITSEYFIWVDLYRIETYLLLKDNNYFKLIKRFKCATGANITPTKRGFYSISSKGTHFYSRDNTYICYNYLQYSGSYLLHSFPYSLNKEVLDDSINARVSNGCVRFNFDDSKFLFDTIPINTNIWVN